VATRVASEACGVFPFHCDPSQTYRPAECAVPSSPTDSKLSATVNDNVLLMGGTYTAVVRGQGSITVNKAVDLARSIVPGGAAVSVAMSKPGQDALLSFDGTAGKRLAIKVTDTFAITGGPWPCPLSVLLARTL